MAKYGILTTTKNKTIVSYAVADYDNYPDDPSTFMPEHQEWYRRQMLDNFKVALFLVHGRQSEKEAHKRATEYADYLNRQHDAIEIATKLVTI
jgi:hypothetical protein